MSLMTYLIGVVLAYIIVRIHISQENKADKEKRSWEDAWINLAMSIFSWVAVVGIGIIIIGKWAYKKKFKKPDWF